MKSLGAILSVVIGALGLIYDLWLIQSGYLHAAALLGLTAWMALLLWFCARSKGERREWGLTDRESRSQRPGSRFRTQNQ